MCGCWADDRGLPHVHAVAGSVIMALRPARPGVGQARGQRGAGPDRDGVARGRPAEGVTLTRNPYSRKAPVATGDERHGRDQPSGPGQPTRGLRPQRVDRRGHVPALPRGPVQRGPGVARLLRRLPARLGRDRTGSTCPTRGTDQADGTARIHRTSLAVRTHGPVRSHGTADADHAAEAGSGTGRSTRAVSSGCSGSGYREARSHGNTEGGAAGTERWS
jgi:hypothetical protein